MHYAEALKPLVNVGLPRTDSSSQSRRLMVIGFGKCTGSQSPSVANTDSALAFITLCVSAKLQRPPHYFLYLL